MEGWSALFKREIHRRIVEESIPRAIQCLDLLEEAEIWHRPNASSNSVGNLVLHVCGNARQWILAGLGGREDQRDRDREFSDSVFVPTETLQSQLAQLAIELSPCIQRLKPEQLLKSYRVQGFDETGIGILVHVAEHFSYHVGQITYIVKAMKDISTGYYDGLALNV